MTAILLWLTQNWRVVALLGLIGLAYGYHRYALHGADSAGYERSQNEYLIAQAKANQKAAEKLEKGNAEAAVIYRTITKEVDKIIDRPVYRNVCVDPDGLRLINQALTKSLPLPRPDRP